MPDIILNDIYFIESRGDQIICNFRDGNGVLQRENLGSPFSLLPEIFPWTCLMGDKGFLINFQNVESYNPFTIRNGQLSVQLKAAKGEILEGEYSFTGLEDFPDAFTNSAQVKGGTAIIFKDSEIAGHAGDRKIALMIPVSIDVIDALKQRQLASRPVSTIRVSHVPTSETPKLI